MLNKDPLDYVYTNDYDKLFMSVPSNRLSDMG